MDFAAFHRKLHGVSPFPWQARLARCVAAGDWPASLSLPTSAGKTALVDIWLWGHATGLAAMPRRLYYVIDRRVLVDAVAARAAAAVAVLGLDIPVVRLRGGAETTDDAWLLDPSRPALIGTTVDQLGSRLLGRAYGVGRYSAPLHAGLAGNDALIVIDEAHLVAPLCQTLDAVARLRARADRPLGLPWRVLAMTGTPLAEAPPFTLDAEDYAHPLLARRLNAAKCMRLVKAAGGLPEALAREALALRARGAAVVGVVANTVDVARDAHARLAAAGETLLAIGRVRPAERAALAETLMARAGTGTRATGRAPLFVVATQCIEVGVDLDFDALVSAHAPLSALRQRCGRLDRLGELGATAGAIVRAAAPALPYAKAELDAAWQWLEAQATRGRGAEKSVDFGVRALPAPPSETAKRAPVMLPGDIERLFDPGIEADITPYLHGEKREMDIYIAWRAALDAPGIDWAEAVEDAPPLGAELMPLPLRAARAWLAGDVAPVADIDAAAGEAEAPRARRPRQLVVRWDGEAAQTVDAMRLCVGDVIVVPASYGGYDCFGWNPASIAPVADLLASGQVVRRGWHGDSARTRRAVDLTPHLAAVGARAAELARACGLPEDLVLAVGAAGRLHDLGKLDPRYQLMLGGEPNRPLAKSGPHEPGVSRQLAGLPRGWRHELASLAQCAAAPALTRYLVASHHGRGRPWLPVAPDPALWRRAAGADFPALAVRLRAEFGLWGLAYLEALLRLADWAVSADEQRVEESNDAA